MTRPVNIAESTDADIDALAALYRDTFPDEDLMPVVRDILAGDARFLSLIARHDRAVVGHVLFTLCAIDGQAAPVALLAPLGVSPSCQRQGIGGALVEEGFRGLTQDGIADVYVLGDPAYYRRLGFRTETGVAPPYDLPEDWRGAWQSIRLREGGAPATGRLMVPAPWQHPELWRD